jgi:hypothetical protein
MSNENQTPSTSAAGSGSGGVFEGIRGEKSRDTESDSVLAAEKDATAPVRRQRVATVHEKSNSGSVRPSSSDKSQRWGRGLNSVLRFSKLQEANKS